MASLALIADTPQVGGFTDLFDGQDAVSHDTAIGPCTLPRKPSRVEVTLDHIEQEKRLRMGRLRHAAIVAPERFTGCTPLVYPYAWNVTTRGGKRCIID